MKCQKKYHRNPSIASAVIVPILPYALLGTVLYFYGGKIANLLGAKVAGVDTLKFKSDVKTVSSASGKDVVNALTGNVFQTKYISPTEQKAAIAAIKTKTAVPTPPKTIIPAKIKTAVSKISGMASEQKVALTAGITTIESATVSELVSGFKGLFSGGIWGTPATPYISPTEQAAAIAKIKATKGL